MKRLAIALGLIVSCISGFAQGQINFLTPSASGTWRIFINDSSSTDSNNLVRVQMPTTAGQYSFFIQYGLTGGPLNQTSATFQNSTFTTGKIGESGVSVPITVDVAFTTGIDLQVFGYSTAAGSYANALATPGFYAGSSRVAVNLLPTQSPSPAQTVFAATSAGIVGFDLFLTQPVPEPATFALAGLGLAGLVLIRRRK